MDDRTLLELAAKAAGIKWYGIAGDDQSDCLYFDIGPDDVIEWNPLQSSADAFDLAVALHMKVKVQKFGYTECTAIVGFVPELRKVKSFVRVERHGNDKAAATRLAITRCAAALAEQRTGGRE